jgi:hypothetical protein
MAFTIKQWAGKLSKDWMDSFPELAGIFYIDGHVIVYFGHQTKMPKHYVTRLKLCMSGECCSKMQEVAKRYGQEKSERNQHQDIKHQLLQPIFH